MGLTDRISRSLDVGHDWGDGMDPRVCYGEAECVDGPCPLLEEADPDEGDILDKIGADSCGACGCTIGGLSFSNSRPSNCPRKEEHDQATD